MQATEEFRSYPLAFLPLSNTRLAVLAYFLTGPGTTGDVSEACEIDTVRAWRTVKEFAASGWLVPATRRRYAITERGRAEIVRIHHELSLLLGPIANLTNRQG